MREPLARFSGFPVVACAHSPSLDALRSGFWCGLGSETPPQDVLSSHSTPERQSLFESHRQRRWLTRWSYVGKKAEPRWLWHAIDHPSGTVLAYVFGRRQEICRSYYDSRKSLYLVAACGNHQCIGFVKARTVVSMSARRSCRRYRMYKPDNSPPPPMSLSAAQAQSPQETPLCSSGRPSLWRRVGSCPSSLRVNTRDLPGDRHKNKKA